MERFDGMDEWLDSQGFYRKHTGKDGSCLFRAVSEQVFHTQVMHLEVRKACVRHMEKNKEKFVEFIEGSYDEYLDKLRNPKENAGQVEMSVMAVMYNRDFLVFQEVGERPCKVTDYGFSRKILLCWSPTNQFDSVYFKGYISNAAICQSIVYDFLYKKVFRMGDEVDLAIEKMLHDKDYAKLRRDSTASIESNSAAHDFGIEQGDSSNDHCKDKNGSLDIRRSLEQGFPPFPYKVAKALDEEIYRNVEFDVWNEERKDETVFEPGVKCLVRLNKSEPEAYHAHIQEVSPNKGPVTVYIVELGKKQTVTFESLEPLPSYNRAGWQSFGKNYKPLSPYYRKPPINGTVTGMDRYRIRRKIFKKGKSKEYPFPMSLGRGQSLPPLQPQYDSSILQIGRGRNGFHGITRNSSHVKWLSPLSQNRRYHSKNSGGRYFVPNVEINTHDTHKFYDKVPFNGSSNIPNQDRMPPSHVQMSTSSATSVTWVKSVGSVTPTSVYSSTSVTSSPSQFKSDVAPSTTNSQKDETEVVSILPPLHSVKAPSCVSGATMGSNFSQGVLAPSYFTSCNYPATSPSTPSQAPQAVHSQNSPPSYLSSPPPVTVFPYHYCSGIYVPFEHPSQPVNYSVSRSQDPNGSDLPLQDPATLRFFFNLGCDYFRMAAVIPVPSATHYAMLNFGNQVAYSSVNGYLTPMSSPDGCEGSEESSSTSVAGLSPSDSTTETESSPHSDELYEPTYLCGSAPVSFIPAAVYHPVDYCTSVPVGEFKGGLVLNDQGILTLNSSVCVPPISFSQSFPRHRSDSCSSNFSQSSNQDGNSANNHLKYQSNNNNNSYGGPLCEGHGSTNNGNGMKQPLGISTPCHPPPPSNFPMQHLSPQKQSCSPYINPPVMQMGVPPTPTSFSVVQTGSPLYANSTPSIGLFSGNSPGTQAVFTATPGAAYYSSTPPTVLYPAVHPQPVPFMTSTAH